MSLTLFEIWDNIFIFGDFFDKLDLIISASDIFPHLVNDSELWAFYWQMFKYVRWGHDRLEIHPYRLDFDRIFKHVTCVVEPVLNFFYLFLKGFSIDRTLHGQDFERMIVNESL